jgi:Signal transduction histidine kinase
MKNLKKSSPSLTDASDFRKFEVKFYDSLGKLKSLRNLLKSVDYDTRVAVKNDVIQFITEYVEEWSKQNSISLSVYTNGVEYVTEYKAILLIVVLDNILDNAISFKAGNLIIYVMKENGMVSVKFQTDTGHDSGENLNSYFDYGYTTKKRGTGNGMFFVKKIIVDDFHGSVSALEEKGKFITEINLPVLEGD